MRRLQRVTELTQPPIVGRFYLVPTIEGSFFWKRSTVFPVTGPLHSDADYLNFPPMHYHIDGRFLSEHCLTRLLVDRWIENLALLIAGQPITTLQPVVWKRRRCLREQPAYPHERALQRPKTFGKLWAAFAGRQCKAEPSGWICPHRGTALGSLPVQDDVITCPLHGLRVEAQTGRVLL